MNDDRNSMCHWWPLVKDLPIPMPETIIVEIGDELKQFYYDVMDLFGAPEGTKLPDPAWMADIERAADALGYPVFMRTDECSGKHDWERTCFVATREGVRNHVFAVCGANEEADILGLPYRAIVVRKYIEPAAAFTAFWGKLPIGRERRYFVRYGQVQCRHSYWPEEALSSPSVEDWRERLRELNAQSAGEEQLLRGYAEQIAARLEGYWSVDFMCSAEPRWYFIDAALGDDSWHPDCEYAPQPKEDPRIQGLISPVEDAP